MTVTSIPCGLRFLPDREGFCSFIIPLSYSLRPPRIAFIRLRPISLRSRFPTFPFIILQLPRPLLTPCRSDFFFPPFFWSRPSLSSLLMVTKFSPLPVYIGSPISSPRSFLVQFLPVHDQQSLTIQLSICLPGEFLCSRVTKTSLPSKVYLLASVAGASCSLSFFSEMTYYEKMTIRAAIPMYLCLKIELTLVVTTETLLILVF